VNGFFFRTTFGIQILDDIFTIIDPSDRRSIRVTSEMLYLDGIATYKSGLEKLGPNHSLIFEGAGLKIGTVPFNLVATDGGGDKIEKRNEF